MSPVKNGNMFFDLKTDKTFVASTQSDSFQGYRYIRYPDGSPAGMILESQLGDPSFFRLVGQADPPNGQVIW